MKKKAEKRDDGILLLMKKWGSLTGKKYGYVSPQVEEKTSTAQQRKGVPVYSGVIKYFPLALQEVARVSRIGNEQHHSGQPLHWDKSKSTDHLDALVRHLVDHASGIEYDTDGAAHLGKVVWRGLAALQEMLEQKNGKV